MTEMDRARDSYACWCLAIASMREIWIREGIYSPINEIERRWAAEGPRKTNELDTVRA